VIDIKQDRNDRVRRLKQRLRAQSRAGSAIIEFAIVAPVFFLLLFSIMEIGVIYFAQSTIQYATYDVARMIRTGQTQAQGVTQQSIRARICDNIAPLVPCDSDLSVDIESFANFGGVNFAPPLDGNGNMQPMNNYVPGNACNVVLVRVFYAWPVFTPLLTPFLTNMANNKHLLYTATAFRNEPFSPGMSGC
jgi:Flp pilus assembly protein TadG